MIISKEKLAYQQNKGYKKRAIKHTSLESWIVWNEHYLEVGWGQGGF